MQAHYLRSGGWYPTGGGQALSDALVGVVEARGGDVRLRTRATRIVVSEGRAVGVEYEHGPLRTHGVVFAPVIVTNADVKHTLRDLLGREAVPEALYDAAAQYEMAMSFFTLHLGLRLPPDALSWGNSNLWIYDSPALDEAYAPHEDANSL